MPSPINNPETSRALVASLGLKGAFRMAIDEVAVPTTLLETLDKSPYQEPQVGVGNFTDAAAGAGRFSHSGVQPVQGTILQVLWTAVADLGGDGPLEVDLKLYTATQIAGLANFDQLGIPDVNTSFPISGGTPRLGSNLCRGDSAAALGRTLVKAVMPLNGQIKVEFPNGLYLYGNDPNGIGAMMWEVETANTPVNAYHYVREYRVKP